MFKPEDCVFFNTGDTVLVVEGSAKWEDLTCEQCDGEGRKIIDNREWLCSRCNGTGINTEKSGAYKFSVRKKKIADILLFFTGSSGSFSAKDHPMIIGLSNPKKHPYFFTTKAEAEEYAKACNDKGDWV